MLRLAYRRGAGWRGKGRGEAASGWTRLGDHGCRLGGSAAAGGELADVVEEDGTLEGVELGGVSCDLGQERVGHEHGGLVGVAGGGVVQQGRDIHLKGAGEAIERGERGHGLAVLDLGDIGAGNAHAACELTLAEVADVAEIAHGGGDLEALVGVFEGGDKG